MRVQTPSQRQRSIVLVAVYPHNYHSESKPFFVPLEYADYLERIQAATKTIIYAKRKPYVFMVLSKPLTDHLQLRSSTGPALTWACVWAALKGRTAEDDESLALAASFAPQNMPVTVLKSWHTPDVVFAP